MTKITEHLNENFDKLGTYVNLNDDEVKNAMSKYIARHLLKHTSLENESIAKFFAYAFVEISKNEHDKIMLSFNLNIQAEIAIPEYNNHAGVAPPYLY